MMRRQVEKDFLKTLKPAPAKARYGKYERQAQLQLRNPVAQFGWALAAYRRVQIERTLTDGPVPITIEGLVRASAPESYQYARMRFLAIRVTDIPAVKLVGLGKRLLRRNPKDRDVIYYIVPILNYRAPKERAYALSLANSLVRANSKVAAAYIALANANFYAWLATGNKAYGEQAITAYRKHMSMTKVDEIGKRQIARVVKRIRSGRR